MIFVAPHRMKNEYFNSTKLSLWKRLKSDIEPNLTDKNVVLDSYILSPTAYNSLVQNEVTKETWKLNHVLLMENPLYISQLFSESTKSNKDNLQKN